MNRFIHQLFSAYIILVSLASAQWLQTGGPYGASIYSLTTSGTTVVAATLSGIYRTTNDGVTWSQSSGIPATSYVVSIIPSANALYAGTSSGPYVSTDKGITWSGRDSAGQVGYVTAAIGKDSMLFAGTFGGMYSSSNNGKTWSAKDTSIANRQVNCFFVLDKILFAGTQNGLFRSTNNSILWKNADSLVNTVAVTGFVMKGTSLYASASTGVFVSADSGKKWTRVKGATIQIGVLSLATDGTNIVAGTGSNGAYLSTDNGDSWTKLAKLPSSAVKGVTYRGINLFAGHNWGVSFSSNHGTTWSDMNTGITGTAVIGILRMNDELLAITSTSGLFTSINNGLTWNPNPNSVKEVLYYAFHTDTATFRIGTNSGIILSTDGGLTWKSDTIGLGPQLAIGTIVKHGSFFCGSLKGVHEYDGAKWTLRNSGLPKNPYVRLLYSSGSTMFAAVNDSGIFRTNDKGITWVYAGNGIPPATQVNTFITVGNVVTVGTTAGAFTTTNSGNSWKKVSFGLPAGGAHSFALVNNDLFAGTVGSGVYVLKSKDTVWTPVNVGLPGGSIWTLYADKSILFAGTNAGIWRRPLNEMVTSVRSAIAGVPGEFVLRQNYPNPFNPSTTIGFTLQVSGLTTLSIYDAIGREVSTLVNENLNAGVYHERTFTASHLASGIYFARLTSNGRSLMQKMMLVK